MTAQPSMPRRALLRGAAAATAGAALGPLATTAASAASGPLNTGRRDRIDIHCHHIPDFYRAAMADHGITTAGGIAIPSWSPGEALTFMDKFGIQTQVVSISEPGVGFLPTPAERLALARRINDYTAASLVATKDPKLASRFGGFAVLPLGNLNDKQDIKNAQAEAIRASKELKLDGVGLFSSYDGVYLGDGRLADLMATLNQLGATVFVHPVTPKGMPDLGLPGFLFEFPFDTTRAVVNLSYKNVFKLYPRISWILAHAGGTLPFLAYRTSLLQLTAPLAQQLGIKALSNQSIDYRRLYFDTALSPAPSAMMSVKEVTDPSHILFATDWPFAGPVFTIPGDPAPQLQDSFTPTELEGVLRANALAKLPTLRRRLTT